MLLLAEKYRPITAAPFRRNVSYCEIPPCAALRPYIRCFWGTDGADGGAGNNSVVIPDTCSDIIFKKESNGSFSADYCGINDRAFCSESAGNPVFGIRFYPWSAALFPIPIFPERETPSFPPRNISENRSPCCAKGFRSQKRSHSARKPRKTSC